MRAMSGGTTEALDMRKTELGKRRFASATVFAMFNAEAALVDAGCCSQQMGRALLPLILNPYRVY